MNYSTSSKSSPFITTLLSRVSINPLSGCWNWLLYRNKEGYGRATYRGVKYLAHRLVYTLLRGPIKDGLLVLHDCDNSSCVNPDHLFLGTHADNMADKVKKGRQYRTLSEQDVIKIRLSDKTQTELAADFGVRQQQISRIKSGESWSHLA